MKVIFLPLIFVMSVSAMTLEKAEDRLDYLESTLNSTIDLLRLLTCQQCSSRGTEDCINGYCVCLEGYTGPTCSGTGKLTLIFFSFSFLNKLENDEISWNKIRQV